MLTYVNWIGYSYNRYLAIASRAVRNSLKEEQRMAAARRGELDLRFSKWEVSCRVFVLTCQRNRGKGRRLSGMGSSEVN